MRLYVAPVNLISTPMLLDPDSHLKTHLPTSAKVEADLAHLAWRMDRAMRAAIEEFLSNHNEHRHYLTPRTQSSIIHDLIVKQFTSEFGDDDEVAVKKVKNTHELVIRSKYRVRMKKLTGKFFSQNIPTQAVLEFKGQLQLPGMEMWNLVIGYMPPKASVGTLTDSRVYITMPNGEKNAWTWEITNFADEHQSSVPANDQEAAPQKRRAGIRIKKNASQEKDGRSDAAAGDKS
ncbi:hypothetical protein [Sorangium sp. So ce362]|uniref:hypothetical protein n=1 Tax=Sorangium sp. So ce362 TaxID=3133303 RepID=UPI003F638B68